jgi:hypothetical protein
MSFSCAERVLIIRHYFIPKSYAECQRSFRRMCMVPSQWICSQSEQQDMELHNSTRLWGALVQWRNKRVTCNSASPGGWSLFLLRNCDCWLQQDGATTHTHTHTQRMPPWQQWQSFSVTVNEIMATTITVPNNPRFSLLALLETECVHTEPTILQRRQQTPERWTATISANIREKLCSWFGKKNSKHLGELACPRNKLAHDELQ